MTRRHLWWFSLALPIGLLLFVLAQGYLPRWGGRVLKPGPGVPAERETFFQVFYLDDDAVREYCAKEPEDPIGKEIKRKACSPEGWTFQEVDLRGTGGRDFIVSAQNLAFCGAGGQCSHYVYMQTDGGYQRLRFRWDEDMVSDEFPGHGLAPSQRRVRGFLVLLGLLKEYTDKGPKLESVDLVWDGTAYAVGGGDE